MLSVVGPGRPSSTIAIPKRVAAQDQLQSNLAHSGYGSAPRCYEDH
jgi:hypothetical protein